MITDRATVAYLADVYVLEEHRRKGLSKWLMGCILSHPELQGFRRWVLATRDAPRQRAIASFFRPTTAPSTIIRAK